MVGRSIYFMLNVFDSTIPVSCLIAFPPKPKPPGVSSEGFGTF
jgi:hypothetical protein